MRKTRLTQAEQGSRTKNWRKIVAGLVVAAVAAWGGNSAIGQTDYHRITNGTGTWTQTNSWDTVGGGAAVDVPAAIDNAILGTPTSGLPGALTLNGESVNALTVNTTGWSLSGGGLGITNALTIDAAAGTNTFTIDGANISAGSLAFSGTNAARQATLDITNGGQLTTGAGISVGNNRAINLSGGSQLTSQNFNLAAGGTLTAGADTTITTVGQMSIRHDATVGHLVSGGTFTIDPNITLVASSLTIGNQLNDNVDSVIDLGADAAGNGDLTFLHGGTVSGTVRNVKNLQNTGYNNSNPLILNHEIVAADNVENVSSNDGLQLGASIEIGGTLNVRGTLVQNGNVVKAGGLATYGADQTFDADHTSQGLTVDGSLTLDRNNNAVNVDALDGDINIAGAFNIDPASGNTNATSLKGASLTVGGLYTDTRENTVDLGAHPSGAGDMLLKSGGTINGKLENVNNLTAQDDAGDYQELTINQGMTLKGDLVSGSLALADGETYHVEGVMETHGDYVDNGGSLRVEGTTAAPNTQIFGNATVTGDLTTIGLSLDKGDGTFGTLTIGDGTNAAFVDARTGAVDVGNLIVQDGGNSLSGTGINVNGYAAVGNGASIDARSGQFNVGDLDMSSGDNSLAARGITVGGTFADAATSEINARNDKLNLQQGGTINGTVRNVQTLTTDDGTGTFGNLTTTATTVFDNVDDVDTGNLTLGTGFDITGDLHARGTLTQANNVMNIGGTAVYDLGQTFNADHNSDGLYVGGNLTLDRTNNVVNVDAGSDEIWIGGDFSVTPTNGGNTNATSLKGDGLYVGGAYTDTAEHTVDLSGGDPDAYGDMTLVGGGTINGQLINVRDLVSGDLSGSLADLTIAQSNDITGFLITGALTLGTDQAYTVGENLWVDGNYTDNGSLTVVDGILLPWGNFDANAVITGTAEITGTLITNGLEAQILNLSGDGMVNTRDGNVYSNAISLADTSFLATVNMYTDTLDIADGGIVVVQSDAFANTVTLTDDAQLYARNLVVQGSFNDAADTFTQIDDTAYFVHDGTADTDTVSNINGNFIAPNVVLDNGLSDDARVVVNVDANSQYAGGESLTMGQHTLFDSGKDLTYDRVDLRAGNNELNGQNMIIGAYGDAATTKVALAGVANFTDPDGTTIRSADFESVGIVSGDGLGNHYRLSLADGANVNAGYGNPAGNIEAGQTTVGQNATLRGNALTAYGPYSDTASSRVQLSGLATFLDDYPTVIRAGEYSTDGGITHQAGFQSLGLYAGAGLAIADQASVDTGYGNDAGNIEVGNLFVGSSSANVASLRGHNLTVGGIYSDRYDSRVELSGKALFMDMPGTVINSSSFNSVGLETGDGTGGITHLTLGAGANVNAGLGNANGNILVGDLHMELGNTWLAGNNAHIEGDYFDVADSHINIGGTLTLGRVYYTIKSQDFFAHKFDISTDQIVRLDSMAKVHTGDDTIIGPMTQSHMSGALILGDSSEFGSAGTSVINNGAVFFNGDANLLGSLDNQNNGSVVVDYNAYAQVNENFQSRSGSTVEYSLGDRGQIGRLNVGGVASRDPAADGNVNLAGDSWQRNLLGRKASLNALNGRPVEIARADAVSSDNAFALNSDSLFTTVWDMSLNTSVAGDRKSWLLDAQRSVAVPDRSSLLFASVIGWELPKPKHETTVWANVKGGEFNNDPTAFDHYSYQTVQAGFEKTFKGWRPCVNWSAGLFIEGDWLYGDGTFYRGAGLNRFAAGNLTSSYRGASTGLYLSRFTDSGWYFDAVGRIGMYDAEAKMTSYDPNRTASYKGVWTDKMLTLGLEIGKMFKSHNERFAFNPYNRVIYNNAPGNDFGLNYDEVGVAPMLVHNDAIDAWTNRLGGRFIWNSKLRGERTLGNIYLGMDYYQGLGGDLTTDVIDADVLALNRGSQWEPVNLGRTKNDIAYGVGTVGFTIMPTANFSLYTQYDGLFGDVDGWAISLGGKLNF